VKATRFFGINRDFTKKVKAVFMNEEEFNTVSTLFNSPYNTNFIWFVTRGKEGVTVFHKGNKYDFKAKEITKAESFSGVGDAFASGVIYALETGQSIPSAVESGYIRVLEKVKYQHANVAFIDLNQTTKAFELDKLTGCLSRNIFEEEKNNLSGFSHALLIDIDYFKKINDTYGHDYGDVVLKNTAELIKKNIRPTDKLYRYGGEEFLLLLSNITTSNAIKIAERIRKAIQKHGMVTVTIGISEINSSLDASIKQADIALYQGKNSGRNRVISFVAETTVVLN
ncbi:MAG: PfkB family carbohydrate kinase, partial [Thermodesulfovibrio sp.]|nr:PfkB family carbohydrate kinase [Thermodesulfovibrio sp.]